MLSHPDLRDGSASRIYKLSVTAQHRQHRASRRAVADVLLLAGAERSQIKAPPTTAMFILPAHHPMLSGWGAHGPYALACCVTLPCAKSSQQLQLRLPTYFLDYVYTCSCTGVCERKSPILGVPLPYMGRRSLSAPCPGPTGPNLIQLACTHTACWRARPPARSHPSNLPTLTLFGTRTDGLKCLRHGGRVESNWGVQTGGEVVAMGER